MTMAYRRTYKKRSFRRRRSAPWYKRKYNALQLASKAAQGVNYLKGLVNSEKYKHDVTYQAFAGYNGVVTGLTSIAIGDTDSTRTGNSIFVKSVNIRGTMSFNSAGPAIQTVRFMVIVDKQQVGDTAPVASDVLELTGSAFAPLSHLNGNTVGRFTILKSYKVNLSSERPSSNININLNMRHHVRYNGATSSDIQRGGLYVLAISNEFTNDPSLIWTARVSYHDN